MNAIVPKSWVQVDDNQFVRVLESVGKFARLGYSDGIMYYELLCDQPVRFGFNRDDGRYFMNPEYLKQ